MQKIKNNITEYLRAKHKFIFAILLFLNLLGSYWTPLKDTIYISEHQAIIKVVGGVIEKATREQRSQERIARENEYKKIRQEIHEARLSYPLELMQYHVNAPRNPQEIESVVKQWYTDNWGAQIVSFKAILRSDFAKKALKNSMHSKETYKTFINYNK